MTAGRRSSKAEHKISGISLTLGDLRWLVRQCEGMSDSASVTTTTYKSHSPTDWDETSITVKGDQPGR